MRHRRTQLRSEAADLLYSGSAQREREREELSQIEVDPKVSRYPLDLAPDGSRVAVVIPDWQNGRNHLVALRSIAETVHEVILKGWAGLEHLDWSSDGKGWYISGRGADSGTLLRVDCKVAPALSTANRTPSSGRFGALAHPTAGIWPSCATAH